MTRESYRFHRRLTLTALRQLRQFKRDPGSERRGAGHYAETRRELIADLAYIRGAVRP